MGQFNAKILAEFQPPRKWKLGRELSYSTKELMGDEIKALPKIRQKPQEAECYLCIKGAPHNHDKPSACYLCLKNGKSTYFSDIEKYKKHLKTEHFL